MKLLGLSMTLTAAACSTLSPFGRPVPRVIESLQAPVVPEFSATLNVKGSSKAEDNVVLHPNAAGEAFDVRGKAVFTVRDTAGRPELQILISKDKDALTGWEVRTLTTTMEVDKGYRVRMKDIPGEAIPHDRIIRFVVKSRATSDSATYNLRYLDNFKIWGGLGAPVLYRVKGSAKGFGLDDFAPSIAGGPRLVFGSGSHQYIGLNPLITVFRAAQDSSADRPFSLAVGGLVDIGGWFQLGANYQFKDKKTYMIIGVRPEVWSK